MSGEIEARLAAQGIQLPRAPNPVANYVPFTICGDLLFVSGQISKDADGPLIAGHVGDGLSAEQAQAAARVCALNILAQAKAARQIRAAEDA